MGETECKKLYTSFFICTAEGGSRTNRKIVTVAVIAVVSLVSVVLVYFVINMLNPPLTVSFIKSSSEQHFVEGDAIEYVFKVKVTVPSSTYFPFGKQATVTAINRALKPLLDKYDLVTGDYPDDSSMIRTAAWINMYIADGESTFRLYSYKTFSDTQIEALTNDLLDALTVAMKNNP